MAAADIAQLIERHGGDEVAAILKKMLKKPKGDMVAMRQDFDKLLAQPKMGNVSLKQFKAEAVEAWKRKYPQGIPKRSNAYTEFVKANMQSVRDEHPTKPHEEHMKIMGQLWKKHKVTEAAAVGLVESSGDSSSKDEEQIISDDVVNGAQRDDAFHMVTTPKSKARKADDDIAPIPKRSRRSTTPVVTGCRVTRSSSKQ